MPRQRKVAEGLWCVFCPANSPLIKREHMSVHVWQHGVVTWRQVTIGACPWSKRLGYWDLAPAMESLQPRLLED